jgi:hypothetical protein
MKIFKQLLLVFILFISFLNISFVNADIIDINVNNGSADTNLNT